MSDAPGTWTERASEVPGIHHERVTRFLREVLPAASAPDGAADASASDLAAPLRFELVSGGRSNLTYRVRAGSRSFALRRPPLGHVIATAHDMAREFRVLSALADTPVPVPRPIALCEDPAVNDAPFYVMEFCDGIVLQDRVPEGYLETAAEGRAVSEALVDTLVSLHAIDFRAVGLAGLGRPQGYLERQVRRWAKQWQANRTSELPEIEMLLARLAGALPEHSDETIVHGDYRLGNMALDATDPGRVRALFDWEMATLGDPLADLGYTLIYWAEPGEAGAPGSLDAGLVTTRPGFYRRDELVEAYAKRSGRDVGAIDFYQVLALTKLAVIAEGIYKRFQMGKTVGEGFRDTARATKGLAERALAIAARSPDARLRG